jgi:hypothetical protein
MFEIVPPRLGHLVRPCAMFEIVPLSGNHRMNPPLAVVVRRELSADPSAGEPRRDLAKLYRLDVVHPPSLVEEVAPPRNQSRVKQESQLARDCRATQAQLRGDACGTELSQRQERDDLSSGRIGKQVDPDSIATWHGPIVAGTNSPALIAAFQR